jgi:hypothetical protein
MTRKAKKMATALIELHGPSTFRAYFGMAMPADVRVSGHLSARD